MRPEFYYTNKEIRFSHKTKMLLLISKCMSNLDKIELMKARYFALIRERNNPSLSVEELKENKESMLQLEQLFYKQTGRRFTDD